MNASVSPKADNYMNNKTMWCRIWCGGQTKGKDCRHAHLISLCLTLHSNALRKITAKAFQLGPQLYYRGNQVCETIKEGDNIRMVAEFAAIAPRGKVNFA